MKFIRHSLVLTLLSLVGGCTQFNAPEIVFLEPFDCGPLARGELGVVFSTGRGGTGQTYFAKGNPMDVCPKLMQATYVSGVEANYCDSYEPFNQNECRAIKLFTIADYHDAPST